jgi:hypothetical protein
MVNPVFLSTFWDVVWASFIVFFVMIPLILMWVYALVDLFTRRGMSVISRVLWLVLIVFLPFFGALIYLLLRPPD